VNDCEFGVKVCEYNHTAHGAHSKLVVNCGFLISFLK